MKVADYRKMFYISLQVMTDVEFWACADSHLGINTGGWDYAIKQTAHRIWSAWNIMQLNLKTYFSIKCLQLYKIEYRKSYSLDARIKAVDNKQVGVCDKRLLNYAKKLMYEKKIKSLIQ